VNTRDGGTGRRGLNVALRPGGREILIREGKAPSPPPWPPLRDSNPLRARLDPIPPAKQWNDFARG